MGLKLFKDFGDFIQMQEKEVELGNRTILVNIQRKPHMRNINLTVGPDSVRVTAPFFVSEDKIYSFLVEKHKWITKKIDYYSKLPKPFG